MAGLTIRPDPCALDFLSLGALVHRLDPGIIPFRKARSLDIHVSGGEYNVAANLADCFGLKTGVASAMVDYPIGEIVQARVREMGVTPYYKMFEHDGVRGPNIATVYSDRGAGVRAPVVFYNRSHEAGSMLKPGDFDLLFGEARDLDFLLLGTGPIMSRPPKIIIETFARKNIPLDFMSTGSAVRTYGMLLAEKRKVAAAFIAVQDAL